MSTALTRRRLAVLMAGAMLLAACGRKGDLQPVKKDTGKKKDADE